MYRTTRVALRRITHEDQAAFTRLARESADHFEGWISAPTTASGFDDYLVRFDQNTAEGLLLCIRQTGDIAGFVNISYIVRDSYRRGTLGYGTFAPSARQGYMSEGFGSVFRFAFNDLGLHRLEADIQPSNNPSLNLVKKLGFQKEGYSQGLVFIDGAWRDHERWAVTSDIIEAASQ